MSVLARREQKARPNQTSRRRTYATYLHTAQHYIDEGLYRTASNCAQAAIETADRGFNSAFDYHAFDEMAEWLERINEAFDVANAAIASMHEAQHEKAPEHH